MSILEISHLSTYFSVNGKQHAAVNDISFYLNPGETLAIVGESGSGKSVTALSIMGLVEGHCEGRISYCGENLLALSEKKMRTIRGRKIAMIFQEPMTSLNPLMQVGEQVKEMCVIHQLEDRSHELLDLVGVSRWDAYPHELSGGMRQRVMIAIALAGEPDILIADEPTTALDVTVQAQVLDLLKTLQKKIGMAMVFITHDLGVVADVSERICVMYAGEIVETAEVHDLFEKPNHPYTKALLHSLPRLGEKVKRLNSISGSVPSIFDQRGGCMFKDRCLNRFEVCGEKPKIIEVEKNHFSACHLNEV